MITSFEVGAVFKIVDAATMPILKIGAELDKVSVRLKEVHEQLAAFGRTKFAGTAEALKSLDVQFGKIGEASALAKTAVLENFAKADVGIGGTIKEVGRLNTMLAETKNAMKGMRAPGGAADGHARPGHSAFGGDHIMLAIGAGIGAEGIGHGLEKLAEHGMALEHWRQQLLAAGNSGADVAKAVDAAWTTAGKNLNTTATENLKNILELNKATGSLAESTRLLPTFAVAENILGSVKSEHLGHEFTHNNTQTLNFARGLEELGVTQMGKTEEEREANIKMYVREFAKTMIASRGLFDGNSLFAMTNNSGGASQNWDMRMATTVAPVLGEIMKASKLGNANYMAIRSYQGGHITSEAAKALVTNHLAKLGGEDDKNADVYQDEKKSYHLRPNSNFAKGMETNLWDWSSRVLETMKKAGIDITNQHAVNGIINEIGSNKSNSMIMRALLEPLTRLQMQKEFAMRDKVPEDAIGGLQEKDPWMKLDALKKKWDDFLTALGGPLVDPAIAGIDFLTKGLKSMTDWARAHPDAIKNIGAGLAGAAAALGVAGVVAGAIALGSGGVIAGAIATIGGAITGLAALNWKALADGVSSFFDKLKSYLPQFKPAIPKDTGNSFLQQESFGSTGANSGLLRNISFGGPDGANDNSAAAKIVAGTIAGGISNSNVIVMGGSGLSGLGGSGGGFGGGGGSGSWNGKALAIGSGAGIGHVASQADRAAFIKNYAASIGIDPTTALRVAQSEGFYKFTGDNGTSFGDFQMHVGGGLGDRLRRAGIDPSNPNNWRASDKMALDIARREGWGAWHGAGHVGIGNHQGIGIAPRTPMAVSPPPQRDIHIHVHNKQELNGKIIAENTTHHRASNLRFPVAVGAPDSHGHWMSPGTPLPEVA